MCAIIISIRFVFIYCFRFGSYIHHGKDERTSGQSKHMKPHKQLAQTQQNHCTTLSLSLYLSLIHSVARTVAAFNHTQREKNTIYVYNIFDEHYSSRWMALVFLLQFVHLAVSLSLSFFLFRWLSSISYYQCSGLKRFCLSLRRDCRL